MSGLINVRGARSGMVGTTEGTTVAAGGAWTKVYSSATMPSDGRFADVFTADYNVYTIFMTAYLATNAGADMVCRFLTSGDTEASTGNYRAIIQGGELTTGGANSTEYRNTWDGSNMTISAPGGGQTADSNRGGVFGTLTVHNPWQNDKATYISGNLGHLRQENIGKLHSGTLHGGYMATTRIQGIRFYWSAGTTAAVGRVHIYGHTD